MPPHLILELMLNNHDDNSSPANKLHHLQRLGCTCKVWYCFHKTELHPVLEMSNSFTTLVGLLALSICLGLYSNTIEVMHVDQS